MVKFLVVIVGAALALGSESWPGIATPAPLAGFSFSPIDSQQAGRDPVQDLTHLLQVALLWGVETWLEDPTWMSAANRAISILRAA